MVSADYGVDWSSIPDLDFSRQISGASAVLQAVARLLSDRDAGIDLVDELNGEFSPRQLELLKLRIAATARLDERVIDARCDLEFANFILTVTLLVTLAVGEFRLVVAADRLSTKILSVEAI